MTFEKDQVVIIKHHDDFDDYWIGSKATLIRPYMAKNYPGFWLVVVWKKGDTCIVHENSFEVIK